MNQRLLTVFVFALAVAGIASFLVYRAVSAHVQAGPRSQGTRMILASRDLEVGSLVSEADIHEVEWAGTIPGRFVANRQEIVGRGVVTRIYKDEPFIAERLAVRGAGAGMAATIPLGMRAVALRVNDVIGLAGYVLPGMHVDVIVSGNAPQSMQAGMVSRTVLQNIEVLSAGQTIERTVEGKPEDAQVVNLMVTPDQAEILSLAGNETKVQLVLRNPMDRKNESTHGASVAGLFGAPPPPALPIRDTVRQVRQIAVLNPPALVRPVSVPVPVSVEVFSGARRSESTFAGSN